MKNILPLIAMLFLLSACDNTKIQLRAPQEQLADNKTDSTTTLVKDTLKTDSVKVIAKK